MKYKLGILGVGKMGGAILDGVLNKSLFKTEEIAIYTPNISHINKRREQGINILNSEDELFRDSDVILIAIKPQNYEAVFSKLDFNNSYKDKAIISIAPGWSIGKLNGIFKDAFIARAMPNTPAIINLATTTLAYGKNNSSEELKMVVYQILQSIGDVVEIDENKIDEAIPLNGSMPAYILSFLKEFVNKGIEYGFSEEVALSLATSAIIGSVNLALKSNENLDTLIHNVCSKGGSTIAGLEKLYEDGFSKAVSDCFDACVKRSKELGNLSNR